MHSLVWRCIARALGRGAAAVLVAVAAASIAQSLLDPALSSVAEIGSLEHLRLVLVNAIPVACIGLILFALTARPWVSAGLCFTVLATLHAVNSLKLLNLGLPLLPADLHFLRAGHGEGQLFAQYASLPALIVPLLGIGATAVALWYERRRRAVAGWPRVALGLVGVALGASLLFAVPPWGRLFDRSALRFEPWTPAQTEARAGLMPTLLLFRWELVSRPHAPASRIAATRMLAESAPMLRDAMQTGQQTLLPDIVVVQSESFFDPERLRGMPAGTLANFRALAARGTSGELTVPTFGGGTVRTEFEMLTGLALKFLPGIEYPYFELVDRPLPSLPRTLRREGYRTVAIHPHDPGFWNRGQALKQIGIERFIAGEEFRNAPTVGPFVSDAAMTDRILSELKDDGPPQFVFAVSMEAHGPYEWRSNLDPQRLAALPVPAGLDEYGERTLRNYLYHLDDADQELGRLAQALTSRARPTLLLFYGDHLPGLHSTFAQTGFADGRPARAQPTSWLLVDNSTVAAERDDLHSWQLPVRLLAAAGVHADAYFALLGVLHDTIATMDEGHDLAFADALGEIARLRLADEFDELASQTLGDEDDDGPPDAFTPPTEGGG
jgi:hypothetical protein